MYSKIKILGHPIHPMLIAFPVAFYTGSLASFIAYNSNNDIFWFKAGYVANVAGVIMALVAAIPGFIDWLYIPSESKAKKTGVFHLICNVVALLLFAINLWMLKGEWNDTNPGVGAAFILTGAGFVITIIAGFLGWTLVQKHHVGVDMDMV
ncbi:MAG TPA: DUF2231 domain-containing protein [Hanamia sp.]|nr:DUF2231 domain-containing protein [Hanamia sp.]